jgi:FAD/FMN-containing dehydrogenase
MKTIKNKIVYEENINNIKGKATTIVFPDSIDEIKNLVKLSNEDLVPRGSGSSFTGGVIPKNSVVIDFSKMNRIIELSSAKKTVTLEPGVILAELNEELEPYSLEFPIVPLFGGIETIGGMIAKNSAGNREIKYGRMLGWIDSLEVIDSKGEQIKVSKSDLSDFVGMEGTTGLIIQATLRLTSKKQRTITILKAASLDDVFIANRKLRLKQDISSIDLISKELSSLLGLEKKHHIFVELESNEGSFRGDDYHKFVKLKNRAYKKAALEGFIYISNVKFLIDSLQDFLIYLEEKNIPYLAHLASGVVYPFFRAEQIEKIEDAMKLAKRLRGKIAYNFGVGLTKKNVLEPGEIELMRRVKMRQDPQFRFNRDKLIDLKPSSKPPVLNEPKPAEEANPKIEAEPQESQLISQAETTTLKRKEEELSPEEREKIRKIASGFFGGKKE